MKIVVAWEDRRGHWHIGTAVYGPKNAMEHTTGLTCIWERKGMWQGRDDGFHWYVDPKHLREIEAAGP